MTAKELVSSYMQEVWVERKIASIEKYISPTEFIQHNAHLENGLEALKKFLYYFFYTLMPTGIWEVKRIIAEDNMVVVHSLSKPAPKTLGTVVVDIFRIENEKLVEHWDVVSDVPEKTVSGNSVV
jgi:predicted SnoaL-like aldol condensation-catalyzing enzyme